MTRQRADTSENSRQINRQRRRRSDRGSRRRGSWAPARASAESGTVSVIRSSLSSGRSRARRCHASIRSSRGHMTESMPSRLTPRSRNGITVAGRSLPPASPQAATLARYLSWVRIVASVVAADRVDRAGPALAVERPRRLRRERRAIDQLGGAEPGQIVALLGAAGRGDDPMAEPRQQRDRDAADAAGGAGHQHLAAAGLEPVPLERDHRQHRGEPGGADRHRLAGAEPVRPAHQIGSALTRAFSA